MYVWLYGYREKERTREGKYPEMDERTFDGYGRLVNKQQARNRDKDSRSLERDVLKESEVVFFQ